MSYHIMLHVSCCIKLHCIILCPVVLYLILCLLYLLGSEHVDSYFVILNCVWSFYCFKAIINMLCGIISCHVMLCWLISFPIILWCIIKSNILFYHIILSHHVLYCSVSNRMSSHCTVSYVCHSLWYQSVVSYCVVLYHKVSYHVVSFAFHLLLSPVM